MIESDAVAHPSATVAEGDAEVTTCGDAAPLAEAEDAGAEAETDVAEEAALDGDETAEDVTEVVAEEDPVAQPATATTTAPAATAPPARSNRPVEPIITSTPFFSERRVRRTRRPRATD